MRRGTTPAIDIKINGIDCDYIEKCFVTIKQNANEKTYQVSPDDKGSLKVCLSQNDTLSFSSGIVSIQVKAKLKDGNVVASSIYRAYMHEILNTEVI